MDARESATAALGTAPSGPGLFEFDAFLSYSTRGNYLLCRRIEAFLEGFHRRVDDDGRALRPLQICRDGSDFRQWLAGPAGQVPHFVWQRIESALRRCRRLLVVCSAESAASPWVDREVAWMLQHRGADHVWLIVASGADPAGQPEGVVPPSAIAANLHNRQIWYDLRQWRGQRGERVRDAEDELVRLAVDLLELPADTQPGLAAIWQREEARRTRRMAQLAAAAALAVTVGACVASWQFIEARRQALQAQAASQVRVAEAALSRSPLLAALVAQDWQAEHVPADALALGWRLLGSEIPQARLRGHQQALVAAGWIPGNRVWAVDSSGAMSLSRADGQGDAVWLRPVAPVKVVAAQASADGQLLWLAESGGAVRQVRQVDGALHDDGVVCKLPADDVRHFWAASGTRWLLLAGYQSRVYGCDLDHPGGATQPLPVGGRVLQAGFDGAAGAWQLVTDEGQLWQLPLQDSSLRPVRLPLRPQQAQGLPTAVTGAALVPGRFIALSTSEGVWLGRRDNDVWVLQRIGQVKGVSALAFSTDGNRLALAEKGNGQVRLVRTEDGETLAQLDHESQVFMDPASAELLADRPSRPGRLKVTALSWSPDGQQLATLQEGQGIRLWSAVGGTSAAPRRLRGHAGAKHLVWSAQGDALISAGDDGDMWLWPRRGPLQQAQAILPSRLYAAALEPKVRVLALVNGDEQLLLLNADQLDQPPTLLSTSERCADTDASLAKRRLDPALTFDARGRLWWLRRDGGLSVISGVSATTGSATLSIRHWCTGAVVARLVPELPGVVLMNERRSVVMVDEVGSHAVGDTSAMQPVSVIAASAGGRWVAVGTQGGQVVRWDLAARPVAALEEMKPHTSAVSCLALDESTGGVLSMTSDGQAVWQPEVGQVLRWQGDGGSLQPCVLAGGMGYAAADSGRLWRLDLQAASAPQSFESETGVAHIGPLMHLLPLPDQDMLLTGGGVDGQLSLWSLALRHRLASSFLASTVVAMVPDIMRYRVIAVGEGGRIVALPLDLPTLQMQLQAATSASLTPAERSNLLGEPADVAYAAYSSKERSQTRTPLSRDWRFKLPF